MTDSVSAREWGRFPTDEMSLRGLIEACTCNEETGRSHLHDYLDMTARIESVTNQETGESFPDMDSALEAADDCAGTSIFLVEHESGTTPHSGNSVIISLAEELLRLRGEERVAMTTCSCRWPRGGCDDCPRSKLSPRYWWKFLRSQT